MYKRGDILKSKNGTQNKIFIMCIEDSYVILYDNLSNNIVGDTTSGIFLDDFELSSIQELSNFIITNNL